jgi:hypothetical protein
MGVHNLFDIILSWNGVLTERKKKYIHYGSIRNFVLHIDEIRDEKTRQIIIDTLTDYVAEVKSNDYDFNGSSSTVLARKYLFPICHYYREDSKFMRFIKIDNVLLYGMLSDSLLYLTGILPKIYYIPIITITLLLYYFFVGLVKVPENRVYGMFY